MQHVAGASEKRDALLGGLSRRAGIHFEHEQRFALSLCVPILGDIAKDRGELRLVTQLEFGDRSLGGKELATATASPDLAAMPHLPCVITRIPKTIEMGVMAVSYTHLTLPTNREV